MNQVQSESGSAIQEVRCAERREERCVECRIRFCQYQHLRATFQAASWTGPVFSRLPFTLSLFTGSTHLDSGITVSQNSGNTV